MRSVVRFIVGVVLLLPSLLQAQGNGGGNQVRLKELVSLEGATPIQLIGYGLVVGLERTGDRARGRRGSPYTVQSIANMLRNFGITVDPALLSSRNAAAVMVTAYLSPYQQAGTSIDVTVSALGDARSLNGGVLLQTPLTNPLNGQVYAMAQGPLSTGGVEASARGSGVRINHTNTGRIPGGAVVTRAVPFQPPADGTLGLALKHPDFTNALRIAEAINQQYPDAARVVHSGLVRVTLPQEQNAFPAFMAALEGMRIDVDVPARVVINERTGTIVTGGNVRISEVMVTYGSIVISTQVEPDVSQPNPFGQGQTVVVERGTASVEEEQTRSVVLTPNTTVSELAATLNELGLTARDLIAIFQAIDRAGALQAELVIL